MGLEDKVVMMTVTMGAKVSLLHLGQDSLSILTWL